MNNIKQHFAAYVQRFVNVVCNKKQVMESMASDKKAAFTKRLQKIKTQILSRFQNLGLTTLRNGSHLPSALAQL